MTHERDHGYAKYRLEGCRCYPCAAARSAYDENRNRAIAYGTWRPWVDAEPVRVHVQHLQECGLGLRTITDLSGVARSALVGILRGRPGRAPAEKVRPATAQRILAIEATLDNLAASTTIDSTGTVRRLRALVALGWSQAKLSARLGITPPNFTVMMSAAQVTARTARAVRDLYDRLWDEAPPEESHRDKIAASRARNLAGDRGWVSPLAWDDDRIEDPAAVPDLGTEASRQDALFEDSEELLRQGFTVEQAADRLNVAKHYLKRVRRRASRDLEVAA
ncbi:hypothetical protein [Spirillospora sp. NBC_01491]|uniref:hypothetical protein n=1 Tax=Spirillospora sp. NBC_01491 TaxID=2976007 RepID=UPI002E33EF42|nr:hypothetical protein [Spirillospora sp. NBC_01491]